MAKLQFIPPAEKNPIDIQFSESYRRKLKAYENNYLKVLEPELHEKQQMRHWASKIIAKPEHIKTTLVRLCRTKLKEGEFEDADSNIVTGPKAPKEGLYYLLHEEIDNPKSLENGNPPWSFPLSTDTYEVGRYKRSKFQLETNERGDIVKSKVAGGFTCHYLAYDKKEAQAILAKYEKNPKFSFIVREDNNAMTSCSVFNEQEWLEGDIDDLILASKGAYLMKDESYGGLHRYIADKEKKIAEGQQGQPQQSPTKRQYRKPEEDNDAS